MKRNFLSYLLPALLLTSAMSLRADDAPLAVESLPVTQRFAAEDVAEEPRFQKHMVPLFGRLGCNGRSCHGSFQGAGGMQLSLFGYDFKFDHDSLTKKEENRVNTESPLESLIIAKPTSEEDHEGGQRYERGGWEYHMIRRWIESGAKFSASEVEKLVALEVTPAEIVFSGDAATAQLRAVAVWSNGAREDVTPLCRFTTNNEQIAKINGDGLVAAAESGDTHVVVSYDKAVVTVPILRPVSQRSGENYPQVVSRTKIDELVVDKLRKLGIVPSDECDDSEFLRRVSLDLAGTLPSAKEVEAFLADASPNKRAEKIDQLLETPAYAAWWTTKLCDFTGNNDVQLNNAAPMRKAGQEWYDWIYKRVSENQSYDELAAGLVLAQSRRPEQSYLEYCEEMSKLYAKDAEGSYAERPTLPHYWARNNFRQPEDRAIGFAYTFMGVRIQCAQCHKHPFDTWSKQDFEDFKAFFTRVTFNRNGAGKGNKEEYEQILKNLGIDPAKKGNQLDRDLQKMVTEGKTIPFAELVATPPRTAAAPKKGKDKDKNDKQAKRSPPMQAGKLLGADEPLNLNEFGDPREPLMQWLRSPENPYFARAFVNRVWATYFNVGIVEPADDLSLGNPPSNKALLDYLTQGFIESKFDMKWLHREIANSVTYQRSWRTNETNVQDERNFSRAVPRRLPAEVAYDAIVRATASDDRAANMLSELKDRGIAVASSNPNANGQGKNGFALKVFGRSIRESNCDCDRAMEASLLQTVYLQNDTDVLAALSPTTRGTWLADVNDAFNPPVKKRDDRGGKEKNSRREVAKVKIRLEAAKKLDDAEKVARLEARLAELKGDAQPMETRPEEPPPSEKPAPEYLVREAYLRTLSRPPNGAEMDRSIAFIAEAGNPVTGLRDLMWALINTKEFIVNH